MITGPEEHQYEEPPMPAPPRQPPTPRQVATAAYQAARRTALSLARDLGAAATSRRAYPGSPFTRPDVEPLAGLRAARHVEMASHRVARDYIRAAREAGYTWDDIGRYLEEELQHGSAAAQVSENAADAAYNYATGTDPETARYYSQSFTWTCPTCDGAISDHGTSNHPADNEQGHADHCPRLAATINAWHAQWDEIEADWEAGQ